MSTKPKEVEGVAVDFDECCDTRRIVPRKTKWCKCGICAVCGFAKHTAVHGPLYGAAKGSRPYHHEFKPRVESP